MAQKRKIIITAITVTSVDGRFTRGDEGNIYHWSSQEDFANFSQVRSLHNLIVMGSGTFDYGLAYQQSGLKPEKERLRIVMTKNPEKYAQYAVSGQLEFTNESPQELVNRLEKEGYERMLFVGGKNLLVPFLQEKLIDEIILTIEPKIFGTGKILEAKKDLDIQLQLKDIKQLNKQGTILLTYDVIQ